MTLSVRSVAIPKEHGAWGYVLEPFVLVLVIAFSLDGMYLLFAAFLFFLAHRPVRLAFSLQTNSENRLLAIGIAIIYIFSGLVILFIIMPWLPLKAMLLFGTGLLIMLFYLVFDIYKKKRSLLGEQIVPIALAFMAINVPVIGNWPDERLIALYFLLLARPVSTTFYINAKIRLEKGLDYSAKMVYLSHLIALFYVIVAALLGWIPYSPVLAMFILFYRAVKGIWISAGRKHVAIKKIGMMEFVYGIAFVIITAVGYLCDL